MPTQEENALSNTPVTVASNELFETGLEELSQGDLIVPRLNILQPTSPDLVEGTAGKFSINVTGDLYDKLNMVIVKFGKSRILFPEKFRRDNLPLCRSHDFLMPAKDIKNEQGDFQPMCETCGLIPGSKLHSCPYANWGEKNAAPECQEVWNLLVINTNTFMPMWFSVKSTALKPLRKIISAISMISTAKRIPMWGMSFDVITEKVTNDSGTFYVPIFSGLTRLDAGDMATMGEIRNQLVDVNIKDSKEQIHDDAPAKSAKPVELALVFKTPLLPEEDEEF